MSAEFTAADSVLRWRAPPSGAPGARAAPALVALDVPQDSPFASLGLAGTRLGLAGDDLRPTMPAPARPLGVRAPRA